LEANLPISFQKYSQRTRFNDTVEWFSLMGAKKKNKSAGPATKRKGKSSRPKSPPARRKTPARKKQPEIAVQPVLNDEKLRELYATMVKCRMLAERVQSVQPSAHKSERGFSGLEAMLVGAGAHLLPQDCIALEHSSFVCSLIKGTPLQSVLARPQTNQNGGAAGTLPSSAQTEGNSITLTMTAVLKHAESMQGSGAVTLMCCTRDPGTLLFESDAMAIAATKKLPMVCLVESSFDSRLELPGHPSGPYVGADPAFYPNIPVDGKDVVAVYRVTQEAVRRAREGHGPAVIECITSRANATGHLSGRDQTAQHVAQDPLKFMEDYLRRKKLWSDEWSHSMVAMFSKELDEAFASVKKPGDLAGKFGNVYSDDGRTSRTAAAPPAQAALTTT
jgi:TPP-dependent pyruvate/acetoin dehydrogenase alpha subunit